jgi:glycosyltransferase involved in cell wall biosynthesis
MSAEPRAPEPLVTVGLPVYNAERYVAHSIDSLLAQTFRSFVIAVSDNASTDATGEICQKYASRDPRIRYHRNPTNVGMAGNYNLTFSLARSKYFRWTTADDYCHPDMLQDAVEVMEADPGVSLCYPRAIFVDGEGRETGRWEDGLHLMQDDPVARFCAVVKGLGRVHHHLGLMRVDCMRRTGLIAKHVASDIGFVAEMALLGKFFQVPKYQFYRRLHEDSSSWAPDEAHQGRRYHASGVRRVPFSRVRYHWRFVQAVRRAPLSAAQRRALYRFLTRHAISDRDRLAGESLRDLGLLIRDTAHSR